MELQTINEINPKTGEVIYCPKNKYHYLKIATGDIVCMDDKLHTSEQIVLIDSGNWRGWVLVTPRALEELNVKTGDMVEWIGYEDIVGPHTLDFITDDGAYVFDTEQGPFTHEPDDPSFRLISRATAATDTPPTWGEMTDAEKGALLLAAHEGKVIEMDASPSNWIECVSFSACQEIAYRIKPEPLVETVTAYSGNPTSGHWGPDNDFDDTHAITFTITNGEPDLDSIKMERINE